MAEWHNAKAMAFKPMIYVINNCFDKNCIKEMKPIQASMMGKKWCKGLLIYQSFVCAVICM